MPRPKRGATALDGILLVDKPLGWTSHDVVGKLRALTGEGRIGHAGTLDPAATGLLVMLIGPATRRADTLLADTKDYRAEIRFGTQTTTDDADGEVIEIADIPAKTFDPKYARILLETFKGECVQIPPDFSALKREGKVAHREARKGKPLSFEPRPVEVYRAELIAIDTEKQSWTVDFSVSKGTYIRALARDIGRAAGTRAHLISLCRTSAGAFSLADAHTIDELEAHCAPDPLAVADYFVDTPRVGPAIVTIGVFDGVHEGHRQLLRSVSERARQEGLLSAAVTFDVLPETVLYPHRSIRTLMSLEEKTAAIKACGIDEVIVLPFTQALAQQSTEDFLLKTLPARVQARALEVGENFRCGIRGEGTPEKMRETLDALPQALPLHIHRLVTSEDGSPYSSTRLREHV